MLRESQRIGVLQEPPRGPGSGLHLDHEEMVVNAHRVDDAFVQEDLGS